jgi:signal transduction histidine kinase/ActR/RegA family two-component response regulator
MIFNRRLKRTIALLTTGALVTLIALRGVALWDLRQKTLEAGERRAANLALISATHVRAAFAAADATLRQLTVYSRQIGGPAAPVDRWEPMLTPSMTQLNGLGSISVVDASGIIRHSTIQAIVGQARHETSIFKQLVATPRDALLADTPFRSVISSRLMLIPIGRRLVNDDGRFAGAVVATFTSAELRNFYQSIDVGRGGEIWVFHPEGFVMFHVPSTTEALGENAAGNPLFEHTRNLTQPDTARMPARDGAPATLTAFRPIGEPPLFAVVSLNESELLANWRRELAISSVVLGLVAVGFAAVLRLVFRQLDARAAVEETLARAQRLDAIGQLTGGVAHDFNNLLTAIMLNLSALKFEPGASARSKTEAVHLDEIEKAAQRAALLVQQMLTFARRQPLQPKLVDLNQLGRDLQPMLTRMLGEDITVKLELATEPCSAEVDPVQVESALVNLCVNARDAMPRGGVLRIATAVTTLDKADRRENADAIPGRYAELQVSDTGTGIAPEVLPKIFEPFFTTKAVGAGTGLGLSMVYGFVKQSGGHVKVQTEVGRGTQVKLYFPLAARTATPGAPVAPVAKATAAARAQSGETILFLEDEPIVRQVGQKMLESLGYRVIAATYGGEALGRAKEMSRIDLLFADVVLPGGLNGREVAEILMRQRPKLRVLFASGYSKHILEDRGQLGPVLRLLTKPYNVEQLAHAVRAAIDDTPHPTANESSLSG